MIPHRWRRNAADNGSSDPNLDVRPNRSANTLLGSVRGLMASGAAARDDAIGELVAGLGGSKTNVYAVSSNEGLIDITTGINNVPAAITSPFLLRLSFDTTLAGSAANVPHLQVDNFDCGPILRRDGSPLVDGDLVKGTPVLVLGDMAAATDTKVTRVRVLDLTPSDVSLLCAGATGGIIAGLVPSGIIGGATSAIMSISVGACADSTLSSFMRTTAVQNWAVTNGAAANGFDGGKTLPASATLGMFLIWGSAGVATLASTSLSAPALPAGYTFFRLLFPFTTDSSGAPVPFTAVESAGGSLVCYLTTPILDVNGLTMTAARQLFALSVPRGLSIEWQGNAYIIGYNSYTTPLAVIVGSPYEPDIDPGTSLSGAIAGSPSGAPTPDIYATNSGGALAAEVTSRRRITDASGRLFVRANQAAGGLYLTTYGWTYSRRI